MLSDSRNDRYMDFGIIVLLIGVALLIRAPGLGKWCITSDEYFLSRSLSFIERSGLPQFPSGGYYVRGILLQYLMIIPVKIFPNREFALRLLPLIFGVLTVPMVYLFCKKFMSDLSSFLCSIILLLSSWHIEFSRFARFYSAFQLVFISFLYFLYTGYFEEKRRSKFLCWAFAVLSVFIFEGSIFLPVILLIIVFLKEENTFINKTKEIFPWFVFLVVLNYLVNEIDYKNWGVRDALPVDLLTKNGKGVWENLPVVTPSTDILMEAWRSYWSLTIYLLIVGMGVYIFRLFFNQMRQDRDTWKWLFVLIVLILPPFHQYGLMGALAVFLLINKPKIREILRSKWKIILGYWTVTLTFWGVLIIFSGNSNKMLHFLVGYPAVKNHIIVPFAENVPFLGLVAASVLFLSVVHSIFYERDPSRIFVLNILLICLLLLSVFKVPERSTRYSFFFFPLVFVLGYLEVDSLVRWIGRKQGESLPRYFRSVLVSIPLILFLASDDFHPLHILDVSSAEANFRIGKYATYQEHWYERFDYDSPATYVNRHFLKGDKVIIDSNPFADYLHNPVYFFSPTDTYWFPQFSRNFGTLEIWSGSPMISTIQSIAELVPKNSGNHLWLISKEKLSGGYSVHEVAQKYHWDVQMAHNGLDGRFKVWMITVHE